VGIGTTNPVYDLDVIGDIRATGSVYYGGTDGSTDGTPYTKPDFVFEKHYKNDFNILEVETFVKKNNHLPWLTSAKEEKEVINMTRMSFETLEAVENMQLQIISLKKENSVLKEDILETKKQVDIEVNKANYKNLEKLEEIYLHMTKLEKRMKMLEVENSKLKNNNSK